MRLPPLIGTVADAAADSLFRAMHHPTALAHVDPTATATTIARAVDLGLDYLAKRQRRDGAWVDFLLFPGASVEWITAHVAFVLEKVPAARVMTARAANYLAAVGRSDGGWGYCRRVANDCDSTAQALMVLETHGIEPSRFIVDWLVAAQTSSGGFPTYPAERGHAANGWQRAHADVTLMVVEAMRRLGVEPERRERAFCWLRDSTTGSVVSSYWWPSPAYAAWLQTRVGFRAPEAGQYAVTLLGGRLPVPELPMIISAAIDDAALDSGTATRAVTALLAQQLRDGSWPCSPILRVTEPSLHEGNPLAGPVFAGARRVFSTAHAIAALTAYRERASLTDGNNATA